MELQAIICDLEDGLFSGERLNQSVVDILWTYRHTARIFLVSSADKSYEEAAKAKISELNMGFAVPLMMGGDPQEALELFTKQVLEKYNPLFVITGMSNYKFWGTFLNRDVLIVTSIFNERT